MTTRSFAITRIPRSSPGFCRPLAERADACGYALERLVIVTPSPTAVEAERALAMLRSRIGVYCQNGAGTVLVAKD